MPQPPSHSAQSGKHGKELDREVTIKELDAVIRELKPGKAVGLDGVNPEMVKCMTEGTRRYVLAFVNKCITSRRMPEDLMKGQLKLLFKAEHSGKSMDKTPKSHEYFLFLIQCNIT